jgi:hypothetical protein
MRCPSCERNIALIRHAWDCPERKRWRTAKIGSPVRGQKGGIDPEGRQGSDRAPGGAWDLARERLAKPDAERSAKLDADPRTWTPDPGES